MQNYGMYFLYLSTRHVGLFGGVNGGKLWLYYIWFCMKIYKYFILYIIRVYAQLWERLERYVKAIISTQGEISSTICQKLAAKS